MKKAITAIIVMTAISIGKSYGQQPDSSQAGRATYIRNLLKTDTATARRVSRIQDSYKQALKQLLAKAWRNDQQQRAAIDSLIGEKNRRLEELLPEGQRNLLIPTTERRRTWKRDTIAGKKQ